MFVIKLAQSNYFINNKLLLKVLAVILVCIIYSIMSSPSSSFIGITSECDQIFWVSLRIIEDNKHGWRFNVINHRVEPHLIFSVFYWWFFETCYSNGILSSQHFTIIHVSCTIVRLAVFCCSAGINGEINTITIESTYKIALYKEKALSRKQIVQLQNI